MYLKWSLWLSTTLKARTFRVVLNNNGDAGWLWFLPDYKGNNSGVVKYDDNGWLELGKNHIKEILWVLVFKHQQWGIEHYQLSFSAIEIIRFVPIWPMGM